MVSLSDFTPYFIIYGFFIILIVGSVGNIFNIITLATKNFRTHASLFYLLWATVWSQILVIVGITFRLATEYFGNNLINTDRTICKVRNYLLVCLPFMSTMCVFLAAFDRCIGTSLNARWRRLSSISVARHLTPISVTLVGLSGIFLYFVYDVRESRCMIPVEIESLVVNIYVTVFLTSFPIVGMLICSLLTWFNYKRSRNRIATVSHTNGIAQQQTRVMMNEQVIILTLVQCVMSVVIYSTRCGTYVYTISTMSVSKSILQQQIEYLIQQVSIMLLYTNHGIIFYLNYIFSTTFRKTFTTSIRHLISKCFGIPE